MEDFKKKVHESAQFYNESFLNFDFRLTEMNYLSLKPFFVGELALELEASTWSNDQIFSS